jgi:hypothetical protein
MISVEGVDVFIAVGRIDEPGCGRMH